MKPTHILILLLAMLLFAACYHENGKTQHHVETDDYVLTVSGHRLMTNKQVASEPIDTTVFSGDTIRMHDCVTSVALGLYDLTEDWIRSSEPSFFRFNYVLSLELINLPGSDPGSNAVAALNHLRDWGYITIDTTQQRNLALVRPGETFHKAKGDCHYGISPYDLTIPVDLATDSVGNTTLDECMLEWMDGILTTPEEIFSFLKNQGYDTVQIAPPEVQIYPHATRAYRNYSLAWPF